MEPRGEPARDQMTKRLPGQHVAHDEGQQRQRQHESDPEPTRHVHKLGIGPVDGAHRPRLERHAADRARPRPLAHDLRMHRAGPFRLRPRCHHGLERHAALRTIPRSALADLGVHRTGVHPIVGRHAVTLASASSACRASYTIRRRHHRLYARASNRPAIGQKANSSHRASLPVSHDRACVKPGQDEYEGGPGRSVSSTLDLWRLRTVERTVRSLNGNS